MKFTGVKESLSSYSSHEICDSEKIVGFKNQVPTLRTPFESDKAKMKKIEDDSKLATDLSNQLLTYQSIQFNNLGPMIVELNLSNNLLHLIPLQLKNCNNLRILNLTNNQITQLPQFIGSLPLEIFIMNENQLRLLPSQFFKNTNLEILMLNNNIIELLPQELFQLKLKKLGIKSNILITLPHNFINILESLNQLDFEWLQLCGLSFMLNNETKQFLTKLGQRAFQRSEVITFNLFYYCFNQQTFDIMQPIQKSSPSIIYDLIDAEALGLLRQTLQKQSNLIQIQSWDGQSAIQYAYNNRKFRCVNTLLNYYPPKSEILNNLFLLATKKMDINTLKILINYGIDPDYQTPFEISASGKAISSGSTACHIIMQSFGRNVAQQGQAANILKLLLDIGCNPNIKNGDYLTSLHVAIKHPSLAAVRYASQMNGFDFTKRGEFTSESPLHMASVLGLASIIQIIQLKKVNPFTLNKYNKTAKQVSIASLQIIKILRKYELIFLRQTFSNQEEHYAQQRQRNFEKLTDCFDSCRRQHQSHRKITYLNLSQIKKDYSSQTTQQLSSQRSVNSNFIDEIYSQISVIIRNTQSIKEILPQLRQLMELITPLSAKLIVCNITCFILQKSKNQRKFGSHVAPALIHLINSIKFNEQNRLQQSDLVLTLEPFVLKYKEITSQQHKVQESPISQSMRQQLSLNLKHNIENICNEVPEKQEKVYDYSLSIIGWINSIRSVKMNFRNQIKSNRSILQDFEYVQSNFSFKTQYLRTRQKYLDIYREESVDNSESLGSLSDRLSNYRSIRYKRNIKQVQSQPRSGPLSKMVDLLKRKATSQIKPHRGEKSSTIRQDSISKLVSQNDIIEFL
ncbi:negative regulation of T cell migration [Paramecium bursaria]